MPDFLAVGHIARDLTADGWQPGGSVAYAALTASRMGLDTAAVTACASDFDPRAVVSTAAWHRVESATTTIFENTYVTDDNGSHREQRLLGCAQAISFDDISAEWRETPVTLIAPLFRDVQSDITKRLQRHGAIVGLCAQGFLRETAGDRVVRADTPVDPDWLAGDVVFVSTEDVTDEELPMLWAGVVPIVVLTRGSAGCTVWAFGERADYPAFPSREVDATGAGDVFAASFLIRLRETEDVPTAARFASAAGALAVQKRGLDGVPTRAMVNWLLETVSAARQ